MLIQTQVGAARYHELVGKGIATLLLPWLTSSLRHEGKLGQHMAFRNVFIPTGNKCTPQKLHTQYHTLQRRNMYTCCYTATRSKQVRVATIKDHDRPLQCVSKSVGAVDDGSQSPVDKHIRHGVQVIDIVSDCLELEEVEKNLLDVRRRVVRQQTVKAHINAAAWVGLQRAPTDVSR